MDYNLARKIIEDIETKTGVQTISYNGRFAWPVIKYHFFFGLLKWGQVGNSNTSEQKPYTPGLLKKLNAHFRNMRLLVSNYFKAEREFQKLKKVRGNQSVLFLDVTDAEYVDEMTGKKYSRYISPYYEFMKEKRDVFFINVAEKKSAYIKKNEPYYFSSEYGLGNFHIKNYYNKKFNKSRKSISGISLISDAIQNEHYANVLSEDILIEDLELTAAYERLWNKVLAILKPKLIVLECFYGNPNYSGLLAASKKRKIKSVDLQHGISADQMYMGWTKTPNEGYDLLPDYYWCWSKYDVNNIMSSRQQSPALSPMLGGNLWFRKQLSETRKNVSNNHIESLLSCGSYKKIMLVTLQHSIPVSDILIKAINNSDKDWLWLVKFHPLDFVDPEYRNRYKAALKDCKNVEYENTTGADLYFLLKKANVHLTHHSTSSIEAISLKVPTILLGNKFETIFKEFIDSKNFYVAQTETEILGLIEKNITTNEATFDYFKNETSEAVADNLLNQLLN